MRVEAGSGMLDVKGRASSTRRNIQDPLDSFGSQFLDEEVAFCLPSLLPVDELIPLIDQTPDVLVCVVIRVPHILRVRTILLIVVFQG